MQSNRFITYAEALREAIDQSMERNKNIVLIGEGVPDPKSIFKTTLGLQEKYGNKRVFDMPLSENGVTGICIGAALSGLRPILVHQRLDFSLLSLDQLINNASKWYYMFNGQSCVPIVIRMIIGRGWGQGPQHSQSLQSIFASIPGLKVVMPTSPYDAKGMMISSIKDNNPVIFIEHRWLHSISDYVPVDYYETELNSCKILLEGDRLTLVCFSYMSVEGIIACRLLKNYYNINIELIDVRCISPIDIKTITKSIEKTGFVVVADTANKTGSVAGELITQIVEVAFKNLKSAPVRICSPDYPTPSSYTMSEGYYPGPKDIIISVLTILNININDNRFVNINNELLNTKYHDIPYHDFKGPF